MPGSKTAKPALPLALAMYIATSALRTTSWRVVAGVARAGDADAGGDRDVVVADHVRHAELARRAARPWPATAAGPARLGQDRELVAAQPGDEVAVADRAGDPLGHGDEERVAGGVAERVVDDLEVVEVDEQDRA